MCPRAVSDAYRAKNIGYAEAKASLNPYTTTLHVINSAIVKVGKLTYASTVYRGVSGGMLPREFWEKNEHGIRGGVEAGFMSTTQERAVAVGYASGKMQQSSIVIEIEQGMTSRGADISWLSQYPHEKEILFGPLTGLETMSTRAEGASLVVCMRVSVNLKSQTIERLVGQMKFAHLGLLKLLKTQVGEDDTEGKLAKLERRAEARPDDYFNSAEMFKESTVRALDVKGHLEFKKLYEAERKALERANIAPHMFGNLRALYGGVAAVPGFSRPQSDAMAGMKQEHTEEEDSDDVFEQWQVEAGGTVRSTPKIEWYFVTEPTDARLKTLTLDGETLTAWPSEFDADEKKSSGSKPRTPKKLEEFDAKRAEIDRRLAELGQPKMTTAMLVAIRLFTGTMGKQKYNVAMRAKASQTTSAAITKSPTAAVQGLDMRAVFESFDADGSGKITVDELTAAMEKLGTPMPRDKVASMIREVDQDGSASVDFEEFLKVLEATAAPSALLKAFKGNKGNTYATTIHTVHAALMLLSKIAKNRTLWRGTNGLPPSNFFQMDEVYGIKGGVDFAPAGCSPKEAVSVKWATSRTAEDVDANLGVVFEFKCGVDRGAEVGVFSDYPELEEVTLPPCTFLEVQGVRVKRNFIVGEVEGAPEGSPDRYTHHGSVLYIDVAPQFTPSSEAAAGGGATGGARVKQRPSMMSFTQLESTEEVQEEEEEGATSEFPTRPHGDPLRAAMADARYGGAE